MVVVPDPALPGPAGLEAEIDAQWSFLADPGATLTGAQRVRACEIARRARRGEVVDEGPPLDRAAARIGVAAHEIDRRFVDELRDEGVGIHHFVEVLGVVARTTAIDTTLRGLGAPERSLPAPREGVPTDAIDRTARQRSAFVPTVGAAGPTTALNAIPAEATHQERLSEVLYLSYEEMLDFDIRRDLHRTQIELVAARTSSVNECVY